MTKKLYTNYQIFFEEADNGYLVTMTKANEEHAEIMEKQVVFDFSAAVTLIGIKLSEWKKDSLR